MLNPIGACSSGYSVSKKPSAPLLADVAKMIRQHWSVNVTGHYVLDVTCGEDDCQVRDTSQLRNSETNEKSLNDKLVLLTENFTALEDHISVMKEKLINADSHNRSMQESLQHTEIMLR